MSPKILVPLDGSAEAEKVLGLAQRFMPPGGRGILLRVFPTEKAKKGGGRSNRGRHRQGARRAAAMGYLRCVAGHLIDAPGIWRCEVVECDSVAEGIADFAAREHVNLIAMYTHDRKGLAKLIRGSIAQKVQERAPVDVRVFKPKDLVAEAQDPGNLRLYQA